MPLTGPWSLTVFGCAGGSKSLRNKASDRRATQQLEQLAAEVERSVARRRQRQGDVPSISYDNSLPIHARRRDRSGAADHQVIIVCGETGSGKSTQLPKICLESGRGVDGLIGHTQPRRIAARSIATRLAEELDLPWVSRSATRSVSPIERVPKHT